MTILDKLRTGAVTRSAGETQAIAAELAAVLPPDSTLALHGDLGVGKTTFVQGLARGFGVEEIVTSPTFTIFNVHRGRPPSTLVHLDAYRLENAAQLDAIMIDDFLVTPYCLAIEWPDRIAPWIPADALHLDLGISAGEVHTVSLRPAWMSRNT